MNTFVSTQVCNRAEGTICWEKKKKRESESIVYVQLIIPSSPRMAGHILDSTEYTAHFNDSQAALSKIAFAFTRDSTCVVDSVRGGSKFKFANHSFDEPNCHAEVKKSMAENMNRQPFFFLSPTCSLLIAWL